MSRYVPSRLFRLAAAAALASSPAYAGQEVAQIPFFNSPLGTAALGGGLRTGQSLYRAFDQDDQRTGDLLPLYLYNGKVFFFRGAEGGLHMYSNDNVEFNVLGRYRFAQLKPDRNAFYDGIETREQSVDVGVEATLRGGWGELTADWLTDALDRHQGQDVGLAYRYNISRGPWSWSPFISWSWHDQNLTDYYFGVSAAEARPDRPEYRAGESQWITFGLNTAWRMTDRIEFFANVGFGGADSSVRNSPLVEEDQGSTVFIGGTYVFGNTLKPEAYVSKGRESEWSWRVNYGYQADANIVGELDQGDFSKSSVADTRIGGLTASKLLGNGPRVDFYGRLALFRHYESDEGNGDFNSYAAYIMAMGKGYSPWSGDELFRWGFGFGMSYAERVPIAEQRKQAARDRNTSHFLNYLEMTLDFPMRRMFKSDKVRDCYTGVTLVHRSGIFATSDFLGDVAGGADWLTLHLECKR